MPKGGNRWDQNQAACWSATESWDKTLRLAFLLFVAQIPLDIGGLLWVLRP
jgi:hypothetical protein